MPIYSGGGGGGSGALTLISTVTLSSPGTLDVQNIPQTYKDLRLDIVARGADAGATDILLCRFNNDSAAHYGYQDLQMVNAAVTATSFGGDTGASVGRTMPAGGAAANAFDQMQVWINDYASSSIFHGFTVVGGFVGALAAGSILSSFTFGVWNGAAGINRITLLGNSTANLGTGSRLTVYGIG